MLLYLVEQQCYNVVRTSLCCYIKENNSVTVLQDLLYVATLRRTTVL